MSIICKAIDTIKDKKGNTTGYVLLDVTGQRANVQNSKIKQAILNRQIIASNLKVTSNNRLINENIDVSKKFIAVANKLSEISEIEHKKSCVNDFYFYTEFYGTQAYLKGTLDNKEYILGIKDSGEKKVTADNIVEIGRNLKQMYNTSAKQNTDNNKNQDSNDVKTIVLTISKLLYNETRIASENGLKWDANNKVFSINDENTNIVIVADTYYDLVFKNSKINGFKVIAEDRKINGTITLEYCEMQYLEATNDDVNLYSCIVYNTAKFEKATVGSKNLTYINTIIINNFKHVDLAGIIGDKAILNNDVLIMEADFEPMYIKDIEATATNDIYLHGSSWTADNISLTAKHITIGVNQYNKSTDIKLHNRLMLAHGEYTYSNLYMIIANHFSNVDELETLVNINGALAISSLVWRCKFNPDIKVKASNEYSRIYNAEIIQDTIPSTIKIVKGGVAITNHTDITFENIRIAALRESKTKNYKLDSTGIFLIDSEVKNFSITITNSIKPSTKSNMHDLDLVINELKKISEINPIKVYYGTQAYDILSTKGVKLDILNKNEIAQSIKNTSVKEKLLGVTMIDTVDNAVADAIKNVSDGERYPIDTGIDVELPENVISTFNLYVTNNKNTYMNTGIKAILSMLKLFPINNLLFTSDVLNRVSTDTKFRTLTELLYKFENIEVNLISVVYTDISDIDQYVAVVNGRSLLYMAYIGDCELICNLGSSIDIQNGIQAVRKFSAVDFVLGSIEQNITLSSVNKESNCMSNINTLFNRVTAFMLNTKASSIVTVGASGEVVTFKVGYSKTKSSKFDTIYERQYVNCIEKIEPNNVIKSIKNDVSDSYKNSVLLKTKDMAATSVNSDGFIPKCKVSILWQLGMKYYKDGSPSCLTINMFNDIVELPYFNELDEEEFTKALKKARLLHSKIKTDGNFELNEYEFDGKLKKIQNEYMGKIDYLYQAVFMDGSVKYYSTDGRLGDILVNMSKLAQKKRDKSFEEYIQDFIVLKNAYGYENIHQDELAYKLHFGTNNLRFMEVPGDKIYYAIKDAEDNKDYERKEHLLNLIGMTEYEYKQLIGRGICSRDSDMYRKINGEVVAKMPKSQELLCIMGMKEEDFDALVTQYKLDRLASNNKNLMLYSLVTLYLSKHKLQDSNREYATRVGIGICRVTGYCYLFTSNGGYIVPVLRIPSFKEAMILRKQIIEEEADLQNIQGIIQDLGWTHSQDIMETMELQLTNTKEIDKYPQKYRYLVSYVSDESEYEGVNNIENTSVTLESFNQSYLAQFIQMGALQVVVNIPAGYKYNKTYKIKDSNNTITEYTNSNNLFAFKLWDGTSLLSEYSVEELF